METTHEPLQLDMRSSVQQKLMGVPASFIWKIILFGEAFKYGNGVVLKLCSDKCWTTLCRILLFCAMSYLSKMC
jgi:hypothetical protein